MLDHLTINQLNEWEAYDRLDPIGTWRDDFRIAKLESLIVNTARQIYSKKGVHPKMSSPIEFMPDWEGAFLGGSPVKKQSAEEMKNTVLGMAKVHNIQVAREEAHKHRPPKSMKGKKHG